jgi:hypothetical protein
MTCTAFKDAENKRAILQRAIWEKRVIRLRPTVYAYRFHKLRLVWVEPWAAMDMVLLAYLQIKKIEIKAVAIRRADHATPSVRKIWHQLRWQAAVARSV